MGAVALLAASRASAQPAQRIARVGVLTTLAPVPPVFWEPFTATMRERGWTEGRNLHVEQRGTAGKPASALALAKELVSLRMDVILAFGTISALAVRQASSSIPVVTLAGYPVEAGLAQSLARPGGNISGIASYASREVWGKLVECLKDLRLGMRRLGVLWDYVEPGYPDGEIPLPELARAAERLGLAMHTWKLRNEDDLNQALTGVADTRAGGLLITSGGGVVNGSAATRRIAEFLRARRLPAITDIAGAVFRSAGCVLAYSADVRETSSRLADFVDRVLRGAKPSELPFELPSRFILAAHLGNAKAIELTIPASLLARVDQVVE